MSKKKKPNRTKNTEKRGEKLRIQLSFEDTVKGLMAVKMTPKQRIRKPKKT